jgi:hypothetical protein
MSVKGVLCVEVPIFDILLTIEMDGGTQSRQWQ